MICILSYLRTVIEQAQERVNLSSLTMLGDPQPMGGGSGDRLQLCRRLCFVMAGLPRAGSVRLSSLAQEVCKQSPVVTGQGSCRGLERAAALQLCSSQAEEGGALVGIPALCL